MKMIWKIIKVFSIEFWNNPKEGFRLTLILGGFIIKYIIGAIYFGFIEKIIDILKNMVYRIMKI